MTKAANNVEKIHLTLDAEDFSKVEAIAELMKQPGNKPPKPQAVIRMAISEWLKDKV